MRKLLSCLFSMLLLTSALQAQNVARIRSSGDYLWAEGTDIMPSKADEQALDALVRKLAATDILQCGESSCLALWKTYRTDLRNCSKTVATPSGGIMRYIAWRDVEQVFQPRRKKVRELLASAEKSAGKPDVARTYAYWAETYLSSLPPGEQDLHNRLRRLKVSLGDGRTDAVKMRNVESEVQAIRLALAPKGNKSVKTEKSVPAVQAVPAVKKTRQPFGPTVAELPHSGTLSPLPLYWEPGSRDMPSRREAGGSSGNSIAPRFFTASRYPEIAALASVELGLAPAAGAMLSATWKNAGFYLSARSNFTSFGSDYDCFSDGTSPLGYIWPTGEVRRSRLALSAGPMFKLGGSWSVFAGAGYGAQTILWEDTSGSWARVSDLSSKGLLLEAGAMYRLNHLAFSAGISETAFSSVAVTLSAGLLF